VGSNKISGRLVIRQVFEGYIEDTISDEQVLRILEPILKLINEGAFDRPRGLFALGRAIWPWPAEFLFQKRAN